MRGFFRALRAPRRFARDLADHPVMIVEEYPKHSNAVRRLVRKPLSEELASRLLRRPSDPDLHRAVRAFLQVERDPSVAEPFIEPLKIHLPRIDSDDVHRTAKLVASIHPDAAREIARSSQLRLATSFDAKLFDRLLDLAFTELSAHGGLGAVNVLTKVVSANVRKNVASPEILDAVRRLHGLLSDPSPYVGQEHSPAVVSEARILNKQLARALASSRHRDFQKMYLELYRGR